MQWPRNKSNKIVLMVLRDIQKLTENIKSKVDLKQSGYSEETQILIPKGMT